MEVETASTDQEHSQGASYLRAKVELYLERASECFLSGRYRATLNALDGVWRLDPGNIEANTLRDHATDRIKSISRPVHADWLGNHQAAGARRPEIVLIVDQDPRILVGLVESLHGYGFTCVGADSYQEALEVLTFCRPTVVLSEVNFADGPRGFDLFQHCKSIFANIEPLFIFLVARISREIENTGQNMGVEDFIRKPFDCNIVATTVMRALSRHNRTS